MSHHKDMTRKNQQGITLIETMVAITVLIIGLVGAVILATYSIRVTEDSKHEMTGVNLAREGIEVIRNVRDSNWRDGTDWYDGLTTSDYYVPMIDYDDFLNWTLTQVADKGTCFDSHTASTVCQVYKVTNNNYGVDVFANMSAGPVAVGIELESLPYYRIVQIIPRYDGLTIDKLEVHSYVDYQFRGGNWKHIELVEELTNWK